LLTLIWAPEFDYVEEPIGLARGWLRLFRPGWVRLYRGTPERPGIMLALDRGGSCRGVLFRLPPGRVHQGVNAFLHARARVASRKQSCLMNACPHTTPREESSLA
jgi:cation transport regulator ChaC